MKAAPEGAAMEKDDVDGKGLSDKDAEQELLRRKDGRYNLESAAKLLSESGQARYPAILSKLLSAAASETLLTYMPGQYAKNDYLNAGGEFARPEASYDECYWDDLNAWLDKHEKRITYRFPAAVEAHHGKLAPLSATEVAEMKARRKAGRYSFDEAASWIAFLSYKSDEVGDGNWLAPTEEEKIHQAKEAELEREHSAKVYGQMLNNLFVAFKSGALPAFERGSEVRKLNRAADGSAIDASKDDECFWEDLNTWLDEYESRIDFRFLGPSSSAAEVTRPPKLPVGLAQPARILEWLRANGYTPNSLPSYKTGTSTAKAKARAALKDDELFKGRTTAFRKAWEKLREDGEIKENGNGTGPIDPTPPK
jgi:hypothetical protein